MHARAGQTHQLKDAQQADGFGLRRNRRQPETGGDLSFVRHTFSSQMGVFRAQHHGVTESGGILQCPIEHLRIDQWRVGVGERYAAVALELCHFSEALAMQPQGERTGGKYARAAQILGAVTQHLHQPRLIEYRVGVGWADQAGDAAGDRSVHFRNQCVFEFIARFAQARAQINQARSHDQACGIDRLVSLKPGWQHADCGDFFTRDEDVRHVVQPRGRINHTAVADRNVCHLSFPPRCSSLPCARRCRTSLAAG